MTATRESILSNGISGALASTLTITEVEILTSPTARETLTGLTTTETVPAATITETVTGRPITTETTTEQISGLTKTLTTISVTTENLSLALAPIFFAILIITSLTYKKRVLQSKH